MDVSPILFAAQSVGKMMFPASAKKCLYDSHGRRSLDMVSPLRRNAVPSGMVMDMVMAGSASGKSLLAARPTGSLDSAPSRRNWLRLTRLLSGVNSSPFAATDFPSHPRFSSVSRAPMPKDEVESFLAKSVLSSLVCLNHFLLATGILAVGGDVWNHNHVTSL